MMKFMSGKTSQKKSRTDKNFTTNLLDSGIAVIVLSSVIYLLNSLTGYHNLTFLPGLHLFQKYLFLNSDFQPINTLEYQIGIFAVDLILGFALFRLLKASLKPLHFKHSSLSKLKPLKQCSLAIAFLFLLNLIFFQASF